METSPLAASGSETWANQLTAVLCAERDRARQFMAEQYERLEQAEAFVEGELRRLEAELESQHAEAERLRVDRDSLTTRLARMESQLAETERQTTSGSEDVREADEDLQRRYEMAVEDIRQLRNRNAELQQQADKARSTAASLARQSRQSGTLSWEAEKQRILALLETECEGNDESQQAERLKIKDVLQKTDEVIAAKDAEIQELKQQLAQQNPSGVAEMSTATAIEQAINVDSAVCEERERLKQLQEQWREKLRAAEVELAVERAKIARQRAELEEQTRGTKNTASAPPKPSDAEGHADQSGGKRWLARLGLTEADRASRRHL